MPAIPTFHFLGSTGARNEGDFGGREPRMKQILEVGMVIFGGDGLLSKCILCLMSGV